MFKWFGYLGACETEIFSVRRLIAFSLTSIGLLFSVMISSALAQNRLVVTVHEIEVTGSAEGAGRDGPDIYVILECTPDGGITKTHNTSSNLRDDTNPVNSETVPNMMPAVLSCDVPEGTREVTLTIRGREEDGRLNDDDTLDFYPDRPDRGNQADLVMRFYPETQKLIIDDHEDVSWREGKCAFGRIQFQEDESDEGDDVHPARIVFSVSSSLSADGDTDGDGLLDSWEVCGVDRDLDGVVDVDLPAMGADPYRPDIFIEADWFVDDDGVGLADHSHEPWLPALVNAWNEFNFSPRTNPPRPDGTASKGGIALHIDVGNLYANYAFNLNPGDGSNEITPNIDVDGDGIPESLDLDGDGIADIGNLGGLERAPAVGGNRICGDLTAPAPTCSALGETQILTRANATIVKNFNFSPKRADIFRYVIFGHQVNFRASTCDTTGGVGNWGAAPIGGTVNPWETEEQRVDFVVALAQGRPPCRYDR